MRTVILAAVLALAGCVDNIDEVPDDAGMDAGPDAAPLIDPDDVILGLYEGDVRSWQAALGLPPEWTPWMLARKDRFTRAYLNGRTKTAWRIEVRYERPLVYDPPWASEDEHFAALEQMAEAQYPGWDFVFSADDPEADVIMTIGHLGTSYASGNQIYLVWEGIFAHEFGHVVGIPHHYCGSQPDDCPDASPPGEGSCIMNRRSPTWGPTEAFLLRLGERRDDAEVYEMITNINHRYPPGWPY